jgi:sulfur carrier protein
MSEVTDAEAVAASTLEVFVNDRARELRAGATLLSLLAELGLVERKGVAAAVNGAVVARAQWPSHGLLTADRVLIIQATQGG